ncbi:MAG: class I SAM-dependent methyltransferase [Pseudonocardia sp.]|nr:class I SAM-dependent methyltransferase [Pseudonocardia sp.]
MKQDLDSVRNYYCTPRKERADASVYEIWEQGSALNDSITPSTYVPEYRSHIVLKLLSLTADKGSIFSIGCGNGFVEADLVSHGRAVRAIDYNEEAVELTRRKGVDAFTADFFELTPDDVAGTDALYADGLVGHLWDAREQVRPALQKIKSLVLSPGTRLVFSNDSPHDPSAAYAPHDRVDGFWFVSRTYLADELAAAGFEPLESYYFPYLRPLSGMRNRTICVAQVP